MVALMELPEETSSIPAAKHKAKVPAKEVEEVRPDVSAADDNEDGLDDIDVSAAITSKQVAAHQVEITVDGGDADGEEDEEEEACELAFKELKYTNGDVYTGPCKHEDGTWVRHGPDGRLACANGDVYAGRWRHGVRHGNGKMTFATGPHISCEGRWRDDKANGKGVCVYRDGSVYTGTFVGDQREGIGALVVSPSNACYEGAWVRNWPHGKGKWIYADKSTWQGDSVNGEKVRGRAISGDKATEYEGECCGDKWHGKGTCHVDGQWKYQGDWRDGLRHGQGSCMYQGGSVYEGAWQAGARHGKGVYADSEERYDGEWANNRREGHGSCAYATGDKYLGTWSRDERSGMGAMVYARGDRYEGEWREGRRCGKGVCSYANGDKYQGEWVDDSREGWGTCTFADGIRYVGPWRSNGPHQPACAPGLCRASGAGLVRAVAGKQAQAVLETRDERRNRMRRGGEPLTAQLVSSNSNDDVTKVPVSITDNNDGTYALVYVATVVGRYTLEVLVAEQHVAGSPFAVEVACAEADRKKSEIEGKGRKEVEAGEEGQFAVLARDRFGNVVPSKDVLLSVQLTAANGRAIPVTNTTDEAGPISCLYMATELGPYKLEVEVFGKPISGSPFSVRVLDNKSNGVVDAETKDVTLVDKITQWELIAKDAWGNDSGWDSDLDETDEYIKKHNIREWPVAPPEDD